MIYSFGKKFHTVVKKNPKAATCSKPTKQGTPNTKEEIHFRAICTFPSAQLWLKSQIMEWNQYATKQRFEMGTKASE